ncbi:MAG: BTAD domain-containing putative transcriptional regulator [Jatrophihabitantaceae bacterium]
MGCHCADTSYGNEKSTVIHLLGGPFVTVGESRCEVPEGSQRLLAFVALCNGRVDRRYAAGMLWPRGGEGRAAGNLRSALWRLRGAGIDVLAADKMSLAFYPDVLVDVDFIRSWADRLIEQDPREGDLCLAQARVGALDLLPGWYEDWAIVERERVRQRMLHALEALSRMLSNLGRYADAVDAAMVAINSEPLRESAQRVLIEAHLSERNWVEARNRYLAYRRLVRCELGIDPSPDFTALLTGFGVERATVARA